MFPIQGFFTFLIYLRPIYNRARKNNPDCGRLHVVHIALFEDERTARQKVHTSRGRTSTTAGISNVTRVSIAPDLEQEHSPEESNSVSGGIPCSGREEGERESATFHDETHHVSFEDLPADKP
jgi:hypothetical protein